MSKLYTTQEAADYLGICWDTLRERIVQRQLEPTQRAGNSNLWTLDQVESLRTTR